MKIFLWTGEKYYSNDQQDVVFYLNNHEIMFVILVSLFDEVN